MTPPTFDAQTDIDLRLYSVIVSAKVAGWTIEQVIVALADAWIEYDIPKAETVEKES